MIENEVETWMEIKRLDNESKNVVIVVNNDYTSIKVNCTQPYEMAKVCPHVCLAVQDNIRHNKV